MTGHTKSVLPEDAVKVSFYFPKAIHRRLKIEAAERGVTMSMLVIEAIENLVTWLPSPSPEQKGEHN